MAKTTYAPTMVANGKDKMKHNPLHGKYRRNPDDDFGGFGGSETAVASAKPKAGGKAGRPKLSDSQKARNKTAKKTAAGTGGQRGRKPMTASQKAHAKAERAAAGPKPLSLASHITKLVHEAIKEAKVSAKTGVTAKKSADPAKAAAQAAAHLAKKEAAKAKVQKLRDELKEAKSKLSVATKSHHIPSLKISVATPKFEKKPRAHKEGAAKAGRKPMTASQKAHAAAARAEKKAGALVQNPRSGSPRETTAIGPYTMTLLKNPAMDFEVAGIKVVPAAAGAAAAIALGQAVKNLGFVSSMVPSTWKTIIPSAVTVILSAVGYNYAKKNGHEFSAQVCSDAAAFGIFSGINDVVGQQITDMVDKLKKPASETKTETKTTETKTQGLAGSTTRRFAAPQIHGSMIARDLQGETFGYPQANLQGSIQDNQGAQSVLATIHGSRIEQVNGSLIQSAGIDMSDFKEF